MKKLFTFLLCAGYLCIQAQPLKLSWAKQMGGAGHDGKIAIELDHPGNIYTAGWFEGTADFDPGPNVNNVTSYGMQDVVICKYAATGAFVWARSIGGPGRDYITDIALDPSGNIFATGYFNGTADFDPGPGTYNLTSAPGDTSDSFVCKLDPNGNLLWAKQFGKARGYGTYKMTVNKAGASYVTGLFEGTADFDPGTNAHLLKAGGLQDGFILKLDANGNFEWAKQLEGTGNGYALIRCIDLDEAENVLVGGSFWGTFDLDPGPSVLSVTSLGWRDILILKLDANGNLLWEKHFGGKETEDVNALRIAKSGNIYLSGIFGDTTIDVDPGPDVYHLPFNGWTDFFLMKLDKQGNFRWCNAYGGDEYDSGESIDFDSLEQVYLAGRFRTVVDFDPGPATFTLSTIGSGADDSFLMQTDSSGKFIWASQIKGNMNYGRDVKVNQTSEVLMVGGFQNPTDMDPGPGVLVFNPPSGLPDAYLLKLEHDPTVGIKEISPWQLTCYPNPFQNEFYLKVENMKISCLRLFNVIGQEIIDLFHKSA
jgi:hypothetical protein